jgi:hypothetical protein
MKPLHRKIKRSLGLLFLPLAIVSLSAQEKGPDTVKGGDSDAKTAGEKITADTGKFGKALEGISPRVFRSEDGMSSYGIQWDKTFEFKRESALRSVLASVHTSGAWVSENDKELNQTPIVIEGRFGTYRTRSLPVLVTPLTPTDKKLLGGEDLHWGKIEFTTGFQARYETDQSLDHSNGALSVFSFLENKSEDRDVAHPHSFIPSVKLTFDAVFPNENATAESMGMDASDDPYGRIHASVDWLVTVEELLPGTEAGKYLDKLEIHAGLQYSYAFGEDSMLEVTNQDQTFGALIELLIAPSPKGQKILGKLGNIGLPSLGEDDKYYVGYSFGEFTPLPDSENRLMFGTKITF